MNATHYFTFLNELKQQLGSEKLKENTIPDISYNAWQRNIGDTKSSQPYNIEEQLQSKDMETSKYKEYIDLLKEAHNLVLTGAPGTGKTYMARKIAEEMGAETEFVQFHPSYDYTDFVEGLRPVDNGSDQVVFERKDGVFKEFCSRAVQNIIDSKKSPETISEEISWSERLEDFVNDARDYETRYKTVNGSEFTVEDMNEKTILILNEQNDKTPKLAVNVQDILTLLINKVPLKYVRDIRRYFNRRYNSQPDSYAFVIVDKMREKYKKEPHRAANHIPSEGIKEKPFVFIIDEINRGEASKIFGELFYAIDPGYRGDDKNPVQTQYQNLVTDSDDFPNGFYVPKNVYILATMNDIDRSVESMDFAMRRRFTWKEILPKDTECMLDELGQPLADEAKKTMHRLNKVIEDTNGLGAAYMIGPAYFRKLKDNGGSFEKLWKMNLEPLLREYLRGFRRIEDTMEKFKKAFFEEEKVDGNM